MGENRNQRAGGRRRQNLHSNAPAPDVKGLAERSVAITLRVMGFCRSPVV